MKQNSPFLLLGIDSGEYQILAETVNISESEHDFQIEIRLQTKPKVFGKNGVVGLDFFFEFITKSHLTSVQQGSYGAPGGARGVCVQISESGGQEG